MKSIPRVVSACLFLTAAVGCSTPDRDETIARADAALDTIQEQKLTAPDPGAADHFGSSVAVSGTIAVAGTPQDDFGLTVDQGSAYAFVRSGSSFGPAQKLTASDGAARDFFGIDVAASNDTVLVAANGDDVGSFADRGSVYVFVRSGATFTLQQKLAPSTSSAGMFFGSSVALAGDTAFVGASDGVYVFTRSGSTWTERQKLAPPNGALAIDGDSALVSSPGGVIVYVRSGETWSEQQKLVAAGAQLTDQFGSSVALSGDIAIVGTPHKSIGGRNLQGVAYVYMRSGSVWSQQEELTGADSGAFDEFGTSVAVVGATVVVGAFNHTHLGQNSGSGAAYLFVRTGSSWAQDKELRASDYQNGDAFGIAAAVSGSTILIGANNDDQTFQGVGSAYVFRIDGAAQGDTCTTSAQCVNGFCVDGRCCNSACDGACNACSVAAGASQNGICSLVAAGSPGSPACAPLTCTGASAQCSVCASDAQCPAGKYCDGAGVCQTQKELGRTCDATPGADCQVAGCRVCATGTCVGGVCCDGACGAEVHCSANPCQHGGACTDTPTGHACACAPGINGRDCEVVFSQVSAGANQICGLRSDGKIACWGVFMSVDQPPPGTYSWVSMSDQHGCAVRTDSSAVCWGHGSFQPPALSFKSATAGIDHDCGILLDDTVACWGQNPGGEATPPSGTFRALSLSGAYSCGIRSDDSVTCWGLQGPNAQFDVGQATPPPGQFLAISAAGSETCGIRSTGGIACWGLDVTGLRSAPISQYTAIDTSFDNGCALRFDGIVLCFGQEVFGEASPPTGIPPAGTFRAFGVGHDFGCGVRIDDVVRCWGIDMIGSPPTGSL